MTTNIAVRSVGYDDAALAALAEHIECRAWIDLITAAPHWLRRSAGLTVDEIGGALLLAAPGVNHVLFNRVIGLGEQMPATSDIIADIMGRYWDLSIERYWVHAGPHARPARLGRMLQDHGLAPYRRSWVKLMRPAQRADAVETSLNIRLAKHGDAAAVASILGVAFELPQTAAEVFTHVIDRPRWRVYVAETDQQIVAAAGMFSEGEIAYCAFAATRPEFRNRGAQRALLRARIDEAVDAGAHWITTETGFPLAADEPQPSYRNLLHAGFRPVAIRDNYGRPGATWAEAGA